MKSAEQYADDLTRSIAMNGDRVWFAALDVVQEMLAEHDLALKFAAAFAGRWVSERYKDDVDALELEKALLAFVAAGPSR